MVNSPHLEGAIELDSALYDLGLALDSLNLPSDPQTEGDVNRIVDTFKNKSLPDLKLWEYYVVDVTKSKTAFGQAWVEHSNNRAVNGAEAVDLASMNRTDLVDLFANSCFASGWENLGSRYKITVDLPKAIKFVTKLIQSQPSKENAEHATNELGRILNDFNVSRYAMYDDDVKSILQNTASRIKFQRVDDHGPKYGKVTKE